MSAIACIHRHNKTKWKWVMSWSIIALVNRLKAKRHTLFELYIQWVKQSVQFEWLYVRWICMCLCQAIVKSIEIYFWTSLAGQRFKPLLRRNWHFKTLLEYSKFTIHIQNLKKNSERTRRKKIHARYSCSQSNCYITDKTLYRLRKKSNK